MNFNQLKYVVTLASEQNFTKAATKLFITQPTLSIQIKELEKEIGQTLFIRDKKEITLTREGEIFLAFANETLKRLENTKTVMDVNDNTSGQLTIGLFWMFGYNGFGDILNNFTSDYPTIDTHIVIDGSLTLIDKLVNGKIDVAIIVGDYYSDKHEFEHFSNKLNIVPLKESPLILLANKNSDLAYQKSITLNDLDNKSLLNISKNSSLYKIVNNYFETNNIKPHIIGYSSQADICAQIAQYGLAYSFVTLDTYNHLKDVDNIVAIPILPIIARKLYLVHLKDESLQTVNIFKDYVLNSITSN